MKQFLTDICVYQRELRDIIFVKHVNFASSASPHTPSLRPRGSVTNRMAPEVLRDGPTHHVGVFLLVVDSGVGQFYVQVLVDTMEQPANAKIIF